MPGRKYLLLIWAFLVLGACESLSTPQSFDQNLAYSYTGVTAARTTATTLLQSKTISVDDAKMVLNLTDQARAGLDIARIYSSKGDTLNAQSALNLATQVLNQIQVYLKARQGG